MKKYSKEFKDSTVQLIINNNESVAQIAAQNAALARKDLDIHPKTLYAWVTAYKKEHNMPIRNLEKSTILKEGEAEELKRLRY